MENGKWKDRAQPASHSDTRRMDDAAQSRDCHASSWRLLAGPAGSARIKRAYKVRAALLTLLRAMQRKASVIKVPASVTQAHGPAPTRKPRHLLGQEGNRPVKGNWCSRIHTENPGFGPRLPATRAIFQVTFRAISRLEGDHRRKAAHPTWKIENRKLSKSAVRGKASKFRTTPEIARRFPRQICDQCGPSDDRKRPLQI
jgi:hypothetical protein